MVSYVLGKDRGLGGELGLGVVRHPDGAIRAMVAGPVRSHVGAMKVGRNLFSGRSPNEDFGVGVSNTMRSC